MSWGWTAGHTGMGLSAATRFIYPPADFEVRETVWLDNQYVPPMRSVGAGQSNPAFTPAYVSGLDARLDVPQVIRDRVPQ